MTLIATLNLNSPTLLSKPVIPHSSSDTNPLVPVKQNSPRNLTLSHALAWVLLAKPVSSKSYLKSQITQKAFFSIILILYRDSSYL